MKKHLSLFLFATLFVGAFAQKNVGIGTNSPLTKLDVEGALSLREGAPLVLSNGGAKNGVNDNITLLTITGTTDIASFYRITGPTAAFSIYGITPATGVDGEIVTLVNTTGHVMTVINNNSGGAYSGILTQTGANLVDNANSSITLHYNKTVGLWYVTATQNYAVAASSITGTAVSNTSSANNLSTTVDGVTGTAVPMVNSISNTSSANNLSTTVNGILGTAVPMINTHATTWTESAGLTTTANGVAANFTPATGTITQVLGYNSSGVPVYQAATSLGVTSFSAGTTGFTPNSATAGAVTLAGTLNVGNGGTGLATAPSNGQLLIGNGTGYALGTLTGTSNEITVTNAAGSITVATPQAIASTSTPTFANINISGLTSGDPVYATTSGALTTTAPTTGIIGYWTRSAGTPGILSPTTVTDAINVTGVSATTAGTAAISGTETGAGAVYGVNGTITNGTNGAAAIHASPVSGTDVYLGTINSLTNVAGGTVTNPAIYANVTTAGAFGLYISSTSSGAAVMASTSGGNAGNFQTTAASAYGVIGQNFNTGGTGTGYGVAGVNTNSGNAVYGINSGTGSGASSMGVYGLNTSTGTGAQYGVYGSKTGATGTGTGYGVYGTATGTAATNIAGYFTASGGTANYSIIVPSGGGNVGIATSSPGASLEVSRGNGVSQAATQLTGTSADVVIQTLKGAAAPARMAFVSNDAAGGNVSAGAIDGWSNAFGGGASKAISINFPTSQGASAGAVNGNIAFSVNNGTASTLSEAMRIQYNGYVGIGTSGPVQALDVNGVTLHRAGSTSASTTGNQVLFGYAGTATYMHDIKTRHNGGGAAGNAIDFYVWNYTGSDATTAIGTKHVMTLDGTGYVGIGTTTPSGNLYVNATNAGAVTGPSGSLVVNNLVNSAFTKGIWLSNTGGGGAGAYGIDIVGETFNGHTGAAPATIRFVDNNYATDITFRVKTGTGSSNENNGDAEIMRVSSTSGYVGIGTASPGAPLHVANSAGGITTASLARGYFNSGTGGSIQDNTSGSGDIIIQADGYFWANGGGYVATSDSRIKNIIGLSDNQKDLQTLLKIKITDYKYIDEVANGNKPQKKVIAQQVKEYYPIAVNQNVGVIPSVYENASRVTNQGAVTIIETSKPHGFKEGDEVKLVLEKSGEKTFSVSVIDDHTFSVPEKIGGQAFVYGKKVNDLLSVDYDALSTLNISATQELAKQLAEAKAKNEELEQQLAMVKTSCNTIQEQNCDLNEKLNALSSSSSDIQLVQKQLSDLKSLMEKNGIRTEK